MSKEMEKLMRWKEHFENILKEQVAEIPQAIKDLDICIDPPSNEEVKAAVKAINSGKAGGVDGVTEEILNPEEIETPRLLTDIFRYVWESETIPEGRKSDFLSIYPKRAIWKSAITSKVFSKIVNTRLAATLDEYKPKSGFQRQLRLLLHFGALGDRRTTATRLRSKSLRMVKNPGI